MMMKLVEDLDYRGMQEMSNNSVVSTEDDRNEDSCEKKDKSKERNEVKHTEAPIDTLGIEITLVLKYRR